MVDKLLNRFGNLVKGTITGFDRLIFKGHLKPIIFAGGMQSFLYNKNILNKDYKNCVHFVRVYLILSLVQKFLIIV